MLFKELALLSLLLGSGASTTLPLRRRSNSSNDTTATAHMVSTEYGTVFDVEATIGGQTFQLLVDSGSSDLYVMKTGFTCLDKDSGLQLPEEECGYDLTRTYNVSDTYEEIPDQIFGIEYGAGIASGVMAFEEVTVAGVTIPKQRIAVADKSTPMGDGVNSGLLGLGYPSLTSAHPRNITDNTTYWFHRLPYKPALYEMYDRGLIKEPYFAHVLARSPLNESGPVFGGYLSLGELPPVEHNDSWAVAPVQIMNNIPLNFTSYKRTRSYWALTLSASLGSNSTRSNSSVVSAPFQAFLDSGNPLSYIPSQIADPLNNRFSPPGVYNKTLQAYMVDCNAKAPASFSLEIDGQTFTHDPADLIYQTGEGICISSIGNSDEIRLLDDLQLNVIGVPFLKSVVSVFDIGKNEMRFAKLTEEVTNESGHGNDTDGGDENGEEYIPGNDGQQLVPGVLGLAWCLSALVCAFTL